MKKIEDMMGRRTFLLGTAAVIAVSSLALPREAESYTPGPFTARDEHGNTHIIYPTNSGSVYLVHSTADDVWHGPWKLDDPFLGWGVPE